MDDEKSVLCCLICGQEVKSRRVLKDHLIKSHDGFDVQKYVDEYELKNESWLCECGCGQKPPWSIYKFRYARVIKGHISNKIRDKIQSSCRKTRQTEEHKRHKAADAERRRSFFQSEEGQLVKEELKQKCSDSNKELFSSDRGKEILERCLSSRKKFYETDEGLQVLERQSKKLRDFYTTEEGKLVLEKSVQKRIEFFKTERGKEVIRHATELRMKWRAEHFDEYQRSIKDFWDSSQGNDYRRRTVERLRAFYTSDESHSTVERFKRRMDAYRATPKYESDLEKLKERLKEYWTPERRDEFSRTRKEFNTTEQGQAKLKETGKKIKTVLKEFYQSEKGKELCRWRSEYYTGKRKLTFDVVKERIESTCQFELLSEPLEYESKTSILRIRCKDCGEESKRTLVSIESYPICRVCHPLGSFSQIEIYEFIRALVKDVVACDRSIIAPYELDMFCPQKNIAVELNGLYWHSTARPGNSSDYHSNKTEMCLEKGIQLFHVFEDEWHHKRPIVESMIKSRLGLIDRRIFARKCEVKCLTSKERSSFFDSTHIDGDVKSIVAFGLFFHGELVSAISLRRPFHKKYERTVEIARFSSALNTVIVGGLSKLLSKVKSWSVDEGFTSILSYVDQRHGTGESYLKVGFELSSVTEPRFWWTDYKTRFDRFAFRACKSKGLTEKQVSENAKVVRIYGCRSLVMTMQLLRKEDYGSQHEIEDQVQV